MVSMIDRYQLRYFLAVVDAGNFVRAARRVNVTQPTLSVGVAKLERSLGGKLFLRNSQRVQLTEMGVRLLEHARAIEGEFNALERGAPRAAPVAVVRIGVLSSIPGRLIGGLVRTSRAAAEAPGLEIVEGVERELIARLQRRRIDVALTLIRDGESRFESEVLFEEGYALATPDWHAHAGAELLGGEVLGNETMIVRRHCEVLPEASRYFTERGVRPRFSYRSTNDERTVALVKAGLGITVMPDSFAEPGLAMVRLAGFDQVRRIGLMFASREAREACAGVLEALRGVRPEPGPP